MNFEEYQALAEKTSGGFGFTYQGNLDSASFFRMSDLSKVSPFHKFRGQHRLMAASMGLAGEAGELLDVFSKGSSKDLEKEIGDCYWYVSEILSCLQMTFQDLEHESLYDDEETVRSYCKHVAFLTDYFKKVTAHNHPLDRDMAKSLLISVFGKLLEMTIRSKLSVPSILQANIDKLKARYGDKFSTEASLNRGTCG